MNIYLLFKALHLIAVISWMAGLLYLPRIFVYHVENEKKNETLEVFKVMEKKLYYYIMFPAMVLTWIFGILLIYVVGLPSLGFLWLQVKMVLVAVLTIYHFYLGSILSQFKLNNNKHSHKFFRYINEIPTILLILIIFVVIFKPI